jgi:hypothetical protein
MNLFCESLMTLSTTDASFFIISPPIGPTTKLPVYISKHFVTLWQFYYSTYMVKMVELVQSF